jgi:hypothetical protein
MVIMKCELLNFGGYDQLEYDFTTNSSDLHDRCKEPEELEKERNSGYLYKYHLKGKPNFYYRKINIISAYDSQVRSDMMRFLYVVSNAIKYAANHNDFLRDGEVKSTVFKILAPFCAEKRKTSVSMTFVIDDTLCRINLMMYRILKDGTADQYRTDCYIQSIEKSTIDENDMFIDALIKLQKVENVPITPIEIHDPEYKYGRLFVHTDNRLIEEMSSTNKIFYANYDTNNRYTKNTISELIYRGHLRKDPANFKLIDEYMKLSDSSVINVTKRTSSNHSEFILGRIPEGNDIVNFTSVEFKYNYNNNYHLICELYNKEKKYYYLENRTIVNDDKKIKNWKQWIDDVTTLKQRYKMNIILMLIYIRAHIEMEKNTTMFIDDMFDDLHPYVEHRIINELICAFAKDNDENPVDSQIFIASHDIGTYHANQCVYNNIFIRPTPNIDGDNQRFITTIHPESFLDYDMLVGATGIWRFWNFNEFKVRPEVK